MMKLQLAFGLALLSSVSACSDGDGAARARVTDSSGGTVSLASRSYRATTLASVGAIAGRINPADEALVWVDDVSIGKPIGEIRRRTITIENSQFVPRIQDVPVGTTINVFTRDRAGHSARFTRGAEQIAEIRTMDAGQVVPSEAIASRAGIVEARMKSAGGATAYIAAFDHPYHAVTGSDGAFRIDSLPPGTYTIKVWRPGMTEPLAQRVVVLAGGVGQVSFGVQMSSTDFTPSDSAPEQTPPSKLKKDSLD
jgi:hypothetical protein